MPLWKWAAVIEGFLFSNSDEKGQEELHRLLGRSVVFGWTKDAPERELDDPLRWQTNRSGESLLSRHRKQEGA